jgi:hypothetical protein
MKVESKFLTAEVQITGAELSARRVVIDGLVKGFMPMKVIVDGNDLKRLIQLLLKPVLERLESMLPGPLGRALAQVVTTRGEGSPAVEPAR